jgi:hypothetical protein
VLEEPFGDEDANAARQASTTLEEKAAEAMRVQLRSFVEAFVSQDFLPGIYVDFRWSVVASGPRWHGASFRSCLPASQCSTC